MRQNTPDRQEYVLNTALRLFLRHGFKKTSMDDIARAAGMTRQGLYFHYPSKDALARRAIERALEDGLEAVRRALTEEGGPEERLCRAMDAWFGGYVGLFTPPVGPRLGVPLPPAGRRRGGPGLCPVRRPAAGDHGGPAGGPLSSPRAETAAELLCVCGQHWKRTLASHDEFLQKVRAAVELCIAPAGGE